MVGTAGGDRVTVGVLGPVAAWGPDGEPLGLRGPRHRAVLARLAVARGRVVPVRVLVDDLWDVPPPDGVGAVRTFVAALRRALEPERVPRSPARLIVTEGPGYALRLPPGALDADRFARAVADAEQDAAGAVAALEGALAAWRGPAYADLADEPWVRPERARLTELRLHATERLAAARVAAGAASAAVADLDAHVTEHPWREEGWRLLALALSRSGRQADALDVLRRARGLLVEELGLDPGPGLRALEEDVLRQAGPAGPPPGAWSQAAAAYDRAVGAGSRARLQSTVDLLRSLAVTGGPGLAAAREQRLAAVLAAELTGDAALTARVIGAYDVPAVWTRSDDPAQSAGVVAAAERTLARLGPDAPAPVRARLLATVAVESRGVRGPRPLAAAREAERLARELRDPALLAFALDGVWMQTFHRAGLAAERDAVGAELVALSARHALPVPELLGHLVRLQAACARGDLPAADRHATAADALAERQESPLVAVFTAGYRALRADLAGAGYEAAAAGYQAAAALRDGAMPGLERGLLPLTLLALRVRHGRPAPAGDRTDWGPHAPWARPLVLLARGRADAAVAALRALPDPPHDHLLEARWDLAAHAALATGDRPALLRARAALAPAAGGGGDPGELAGAGTGLLTLGPVRDRLAAVDAALAR